MDIQKVISDRGPIFLIGYWKTLFKLGGTKLRFSNAYHPHSNGQTEVLNRYLQQYLFAFVHEKPSVWESFLHWPDWHH